VKNLKQINNKRTLVNLYKDIVLVTRVHIFCTTLFTNNNIKVVIKMHTFLMDLNCKYHHILTTTSNDRQKRNSTLEQQ
jgi:hypothetical protein